VDNTNNQGIWRETSGNLALVARNGSQAPGAALGVNLNEFFAPILNDAGQIAFLASLVGAGVTSANDKGIFATDSSGNLQLIARTGTPIEVASGDSRIISSLSFFTSSEVLIDEPDIAGNGDPLRSGLSRFNKYGQLVFRASFSDGSQGIFVSDQVAGVPGDFDSDGDVDGRDFLVWQRNPSVGDLEDWQTNYGASSLSASIAVPEPGSWALLLGITLLVRRLR
jgi:hypothetical protein